MLAAGLDLAFARRYAGGSATQDHGTNRRLILSLNTNIILGFVLAATGYGRFPGDLTVIAAVGCGLAVIGIGLRYGAVLSLGRFFTWQVSILDGHEIIRRGPYRWLRHPSYTGGFLAVIGSDLALGNWLAPLIFLIVHLPLQLRRITVEEATLQQHFGEAYRRYAAETWRLVPFVY